MYMTNCMCIKLIDFNLLFLNNPSDHGSHIEGIYYIGSNITEILRDI